MPETLDEEFIDNTYWKIGEPKPEDVDVDALLAELEAWDWFSRPTLSVWANSFAYNLYFQHIIMKEHLIYNGEVQDRTSLSFMSVINSIILLI